MTAFNTRQGGHGFLTAHRTSHSLIDTLFPQEYRHHRLIRGIQRTPQEVPIWHWRLG